MKSLIELFPNASKSMLKANSQISTAAVTDFRPIMYKRGKMNKTEAEFALILEAQKRKGEILRYEFEGITLRFAGVKYTPDFVIWKWPQLSPKFIEVKGQWTKGKFERAIERFRHARTYWPEFTFEMHQKSKDGWKQIE